MRNIGVIFAGGTGQRMNTKTKPKQFLELHGKPILVYTLEQFNNHPDIDGIILVILAGWEEYCWQLKERFHINKLDAVVTGGSTAQESALIGLRKACELYQDAIVLIHDGVRPLIDYDTISKDIESVRQHGSAITVSPAIETVTIKGENGEIGQIVERSCCEMARAPQCFYLKDIMEAHLKALNDGNKSFIDSASLMQAYGHKLYSVIGPSENIKITTPSDFYVFRAIIDARENSQIFGV